MVCLWRQLVLLGLLQQQPDLSLSGFQVSHIFCVEMAGLVDASADVIDVGCCSADGTCQLFLFGIVHLDDKSLPYVTELLPEELRRRELFPVGRLDRDTTGLMILTNNGQLAHSLLSPKHHVKKEYFFTAAEPLDADAERDFREGITLADGYECKSAELYLEYNRLEGRIVLTEGKYHQIKRMVASRDNRVTSLERISFGGIELDRTLSRGGWRYLTKEEIEALESQG